MGNQSQSRRDRFKADVSYKALIHYGVEHQSSTLDKQVKGPTTKLQELYFQQKRTQDTSRHWWTYAINLIFFWFILIHMYSFDVFCISIGSKRTAASSVYFHMQIPPDQSSAHKSSNKLIHPTQKQRDYGSLRRGTHSSLQYYMDGVKPFFPYYKTYIILKNKQKGKQSLIFTFYGKSYVPSSFLPDHKCFDTIGFQNTIEQMQVSS